MLNLILAVLTFVVGSVGYDAESLDYITIYNADREFNIDNVDRIVYLYPFGYIVTFEFNPGEFVFVWDYYDYWAISISEEGIQPAEF